MQINTSMSNINIKHLKKSSCEKNNITMQRKKIQNTKYRRTILRTKFSIFLLTSQKQSNISKTSKLCNNFNFHLIRQLRKDEEKIYINQASQMKLGYYYMQANIEIFTSFFFTEVGRNFEFLDP